MRLLLLLWAAIGASTAMVMFSHSALYDIIDVSKEFTQKRIHKCSLGCLIFAATMGDAFDQFPGQMDPYAANIYFYDNMQSENITSVAELAKQVDGNMRKIPLNIDGPADIILDNTFNNPDDESYPIVIYVVEKATADAISFEVYDLADVAGTELQLELDIITFISARPYKLDSPWNSEHNRITVRLAGFDNALDGNEDGCEIAYQTEDDFFFPGFSIQPNTPLISLVIEKKNVVRLQLHYDFSWQRDLSISGFITSPGWNGCRKSDDIGGVQSFRSPYDRPTDSFKLVYNDRLDVQMSVSPNLYGTTSVLTIDDGEDAPVLISDTAPRNLFFPEANRFNISFTDMAGDEGFLLRYVSSSVPQVVTENPDPDTPVIVIVEDNYCNCGIVDGWFDDDWEPKEIWVDLVVILDTSASMGAELEEAKSSLTSFISLMSTDTAAEFYSRIGVVYNLNMSSTDNLDVIQQHNVDKIDVGAAFQAALKMFADGSKKASYRENAKQIVYYLTNSAPGANMNGVDDFKTAGGIIIVNDFVLEGDVADPALRKLASENFFFTDLSENYLNNLAVLCEGNCFCSPSKHAFNDDENSPRTEANRGCFHPVNNGIPQPKARDTCQKEGASLVSIHDQEKEFFVNGVVSIFGPKKKYWLGLQNDGSNWNWDDKSIQSTDSFSDWDVNQPDTNGGKLQCAYAAQTTGLNVRWSAANCAMGGVIYVCESAPCSRGNKNC